MARTPSFSLRLADKWLILIAVTLGMFMSLMDSTVVNVAIPQMQMAFNAGVQDVQWIVTIYMLTQAAVIPTAPYLLARFGAKRAYVWTLTAFLVGSVLCGLAWDLPSLVFFRFIQGVGGGVLLPMVMTILYQTFEPEERGSATSAMGLALMVAPAAGPVVGGYLVSQFGWPWAFFINIPIGLVALFIAQRVLQQTASEGQTQFDRAGFLTIASGSALLLFGVSTFRADGNILQNLVPMLVGFVLIGTFVMIELWKVRHEQQALLDLRRFQDRTFALSSVAHFSVSFGRFGIMFLLPIYLQNLRGQTALESGGIQSAQAIATLAVLPISGRLADRFGARPVVITGLMVLVSGTFLMTTLGLDTSMVMIVGILILLGSAAALLQQIPVSAMSRIGKDERQAVANGSTLLTVLHATAAPMGVATLSSIVQIRGQQYLATLATSDVPAAFSESQSTLLAMHESFFLAAVLVIVALVAMIFVPKRQPHTLTPTQEAEVIVESSLV